MKKRERKNLYRFHNWKSMKYSIHGRGTKSDASALIILVSRTDQNLFFSLAKILVF